MVTDLVQPKKLNFPPIQKNIEKEPILQTEKSLKCLGTYIPYVSIVKCMGLK